MKRFILMSVLFLFETALLAQPLAGPYPVPLSGSSNVIIQGSLTLSNLVFTTPATISTDLAAITSGQTLAFLPGVYTNNNLLKKGVNYYGFGAILSYTERTTNGPGRGTFDDRDIGATTNIIAGAFEIYGTSGTNVYFDNNCDFIAGNPNYISPIVITNPATLLRAYFQRGGAYGISGGLGQGNAAYVKNCADGTIISIDEIVNPQPFGGSFVLTNCAADPGGSYTFALASSGLYWELGNVHFAFKRISQGINLYGIQYYTHADSSATTAESVDAWITGDYCGAKIYGIGTSPNYRMWFDIKEIQNTNAVALEIFGQGKYYFNCQKIESTAGSQTAVSISNGGPTNLDVYLTVQKISSASTWLNVASGFVRANVQHFSALGDVSVGIRVKTNATLELNCLDARSAGVTLQTDGGLAIINGGTFQSTNTSPVFVTGPNLWLKGPVTLLSGGTNAINATNAQTVGVLGVAATITNHANITLSPNGGFNVDANFK